MTKPAKPYRIPGYDCRVMAILLGTITAIMFASSALMSSRSVRMIGSSSVVGWIMLTGTVITTPFLISSGIPTGLTNRDVATLLFSGIANTAGLLLSLKALHIGKVGLVTPIVSTEGALAAVMSTVNGESLKLFVIFALVVIVIGVILAAIAKDPAPLENENAPRAVLLSSLSALGFGSALFATGYLSEVVPLAWLSLPPRLAGTLIVMLPLLLTKRLKVSRKAFPLVILAGFTEVIGFGCFSLGARDSIAIASVMASQFAPIAAIFAFILFKERLGRLQILGIALIVSGVSALTAFSS